jgi:hypothetical protein
MPPARRRHRDHVNRRLRRTLPGGASEVFVQREQSVRLELAEGPAELLLDPVKRVEKRPAVDFHLAATEFPVRPQQKVKPECPVFGFVQKTPADQTEIRNVFLIAAPPDLPPLPAAKDLKPDVTHVFFLPHTILKPSVTGSEDPPEYTLARDLQTSTTAAAQSKSLALRAGLLRQRDCFRTAPVEAHELFLQFVVFHGVYKFNFSQILFAGKQSAFELPGH